MREQQIYEDISNDFKDYTISPKLDSILLILSDHGIEYEFFSHYLEKEKLKKSQPDITELVISGLEQMTLYEVQETIKEQYPEKSNLEFINEQQNKIKESFKQLLEAPIENYNNIAKEAILFTKERIFEEIENAQRKNTHKNKP